MLNSQDLWWSLFLYGLETPGRKEGWCDWRVVWKKPLRMKEETKRCFNRVAHFATKKFQNFLWATTMGSSRCDQRLHETSLLETRTLVCQHQSDVNKFMQCAVDVWVISTCCAAPSKLGALQTHQHAPDRQVPPGRRCVRARGRETPGRREMSWWVLSEESDRRGNRMKDRQRCLSKGDSESSICQGPVYLLIFNTFSLNRRAADSVQLLFRAFKAHSE